MSIRIVTDSTADLPSEVAASLGITVIPLYIHIGGSSYLDGVELTREAFYAGLPTYEAAPTTAAPAPDVFRETYERLAAEGATAILSIHISANLSSTLHVASLGARATTVLPVKVLDSRQLSLGTGFAAETAARLAQNGQDMDTIIAAVDEQILRTHTFAMLDTMEYLRRSGRVNWVVARLGNVLQIKPILRMYDGEAGAERVRTHSQARARVVALLREQAPLARAALVHTHTPERAEELRQECADLLEGLDVPSVDITPVIGAHIGPGAVGFVCVSQRAPYARRR
ncbi:MAG: DegV family protein [Chloroflexi bacterium]|nr:DegV family protein [Chloroflexota bacterium]